ncbi:MAG: peptidase S41 [Variovorax sp.]|nr:MAG: peptidase S41 [Variovorax sp.]
MGKKILKQKAARFAACVAWVIALAACGGGGGGGGPAFLPAATVSAPPADSNPENNIVPSSTVAAQCATPRTGIDPATGTLFPDHQGTSTNEKNWVRAWIDETYLWFDEVPSTLFAKDYATPLAYFDVLKTQKLTASGRPKDRFHFTLDTEAYRSLTTGIDVGYGMELAYLNVSPPRDIRVAYTEPGSPATQATVARGDRLIEIDGIVVENGTDVAGLNAALAPQAEGESHSFTLRANDGAERTVSLKAARVSRSAVQNVKTIDTASGRVGYMLFNDHQAAAEAQLVAAVRQLKDASIADLVIDMRYNGGGLLDVASELASMLSSSAATFGKTFERLQFNGKNSLHLTAAQSTLLFPSTTLGFSVPAGQPLPQLGLSRVTVLAGPDTCSASESVVNSLRGVGVTVNLVGGTTCGKPYAFVPQDNCGTTYFAIQFQGVNQLGFGDYGDGFTPNCAVADDFAHALGDPAEARLAAALTLRDGGACPTPVAAKTDTAIRKAESADEPYLVRSPARENRLLVPGLRKAADGQ